MKVYLSSTYKDLKEYRLAIIKLFNSEALLDQFTLLSMEGYVAKNAIKTKEACERDVKAADIYILVLAENYGSVIEGENISYTEHEYNTAIATRKIKGKDKYSIFVFFSSGLSEKRDFKGDEYKHLLNPGIRAFYEKAKHDNARPVEPFITADNLCNQILLTLIYNFSMLKNVTDYDRFLLLLDRTTPIQYFSEAYLKDNNIFSFSAHYENNAQDFLTRLHENKLKKDYLKCIINLSQLGGSNQSRFNDSVKGLLPGIMKNDREELTGDFSYKSIIAIHINEMELKEDIPQLNQLKNFLKQFLPIYFNKDLNLSQTDRLFLIYFTYTQDDTQLKKKFRKFIGGIKSISKKSIYDLEELRDVDKNDISNWLEMYCSHYIADQNKLDKLLKAEGNPYKKYKMTEAKTLITAFIESNY